MTVFDRLRQEQRDLASVTATAESADTLVTATCSATGELRQLDLDPLLFRDRDPEGLAENIRIAVRDASESAVWRVFAIANGLLPAGTRPGDMVFAVDPVLHELDRLVTRTDEPIPGDDDPTRPTLGAGIDYRAVRRKLADLRDRLARLRAIAEFEDELISATVDGRGRLTELWLHERVYRLTDSRALAERIRATVGAAADAVGDRQRALIRSVWT